LAEVIDLKRKKQRNESSDLAEVIDPKRKNSEMSQAIWQKSLIQKGKTAK